MNAKRVLCLFFCLLTMAFDACFATEFSPPVLNPKTYVSPSGVYALAVDPTDLYGRGPADYRFTKDGKTIWENRLPYSLWEVVVADSGQVGGYAYTHGWRGFSEEGGDRRGELVVALLSAEGKAMNEEKRPRKWSGRQHAPPDPLVEGMVFDATNRQLVLRVRDSDVNRRIQEWWVYDLASGRRIRTLDPVRAMPNLKPGEIQFNLGARAVPGTPLVLTHWWKSVPDNRGAIFTLIDLNDAQARPVWSLTLDGDYSVPGDSKAEQAIHEKVRKDGAILDSNKPSGFAIHAVKQRELIAFSIERAADGTWRVRETGRTPYDFSEPVQEARTFPPVKLDELAAVHLSGAEGRNESPIRDLKGFGFDAEGKICALSVREHSDPHLLYVTQQGEVLKDLRVPAGRLPEVVQFSNPANVGGAKFIVAVLDGEVDRKARCFVGDFGAATVKELPGFDCPAIAALAGFPDGRFSVLIERLARLNSGYVHSGYVLSMFDAEGKPLWRKKESGYEGKPDDLLSPQDITRYGDESIAVLDTVRHIIQFFDTKGAFLRSIDLEETWKREPNYPTHVVEDSQGGLAVYDFDAPSPLVRMDAKGQIKSQCAPKFADGRPVSGGELRRAPDGRIWTTDGDVLLRLSDDGTVDRILGEEATEQDIHSASFATVGPDDRIYVGDRRTNAVHVFSGDGQRVGVCIPDPKDLTETSSVDCVAASPDGNVFVSLDREDQAYLRFDKNLKRAGWARVDLDSVSQEWCFQPTGPLCWIRGYEDVFLVKGLYDVVRKISRRPDRQWLEEPSSIGVAADGSAAVVATSRSGEVSINTYGPTGDPRATYVGPRAWSEFGHVAYDGQTAYFQDHNEVYIIGPHNQCVGSFRLPFDRGRNWWPGPFVAAGGKQLWFVDCQRLMLHKYATAQLDKFSGPKPDRDATANP